MYYAAWRELDVHIPECFDERCLKECVKGGFYLGTRDAADASHYSRTFFTMFGKPTRLESTDLALHRHLHHSLLLNHSAYVNMWVDFLRKFEPMMTLTELVNSSDSSLISKDHKKYFMTEIMKLRGGSQPTKDELEKLNWSVMGFYPLHDLFAAGSWYREEDFDPSKKEKKALMVSSAQFFETFKVESYYGFQRGHLVFRTSEVDDCLKTQASWLLVKRQGCKGLDDFTKFDVGRLLKVIRIRSPNGDVGTAPDMALDLVAVECEWYQAHQMLTDRNGSKHSNGLCVLTRNQTFKDIDRFENAEAVATVRVVVAPDEVNGRRDAVLLQD